MKVFLLIAPVLLIPVLATAAEGRSYGDSAYYPRLDAWPTTAYEFGLTIVPTTTFEKDLGETSQTELDAEWLVFQSDQFLLGTLDMGIVFDLLTYGDTTKIGLPDQLLTLGLDFTATWRYTGDYALQFGARPGLYSEIEAIGTDGLYIPFSGYFLKRLTPSLSGIVGMEIRPGFELGVLPTIGLDWDVSDSVLVRIGVPETRVDVAVGDAWDTFLQLEWENNSYKLDDDEVFFRDTMTVEDLSVALGLTYEFSNGLQLGSELGLLVGRGIEFEVYGPDGVDAIDVDNSGYARFFAKRTF